MISLPKPYCDRLIPINVQIHYKIDGHLVYAQVESLIDIFMSCRARVEAQDDA